MTIDKQIDKMFQEFEDLFQEGWFEEADAAMVEYDYGDDIRLMVALLTITLMAKDKLPSRDAVVEKIRQRIMVLAPDRCARLLQGLH
jgi:hypothetical protein